MLAGVYPFSCSNHNFFLLFHLRENGGGDSDDGGEDEEGGTNQRHLEVRGKDKLFATEVSLRQSPGTWNQNTGSVSKVFFNAFFSATFLAEWICGTEPYA